MVHVRMANQLGNKLERPREGGRGSIRINHVSATQNPDLTQTYWLEIMNDSQTDSAYFDAVFQYEEF